jgi:hypothetical protein
MTMNSALQGRILRWISGLLALCPGLFFAWYVLFTETVSEAHGPGALAKLIATGLSLVFLLSAVFTLLGGTQRVLQIMWIAMALLASAFASFFESEVTGLAPVYLGMLAYCLVGFGTSFSAGRSNGCPAD